MPTDSAAVARAMASLQRARIQSQALGAGGGKKKGPSILGRVFDVISRPMYAVNEGLARTAEHLGAATPQSRQKGNAGLDILKGIAGGLAGKNKTDFGDTMLRSAEADPNSLLSKPIRENRYNIRTIGGLVGDIATDPLTYTGVGLEESIPKAVAKTAGLRAAKSAIETEQNVKRVLEVGNAAREARLAKGAKSIVDVETGTKTVQTAEQVAKKADKLAQRAMNAERDIIASEARNTIGKQVTEGLIRDNPGKVQLKFGLGHNKKVIAESEKLYKGTSTLAKAVGKTAAGSKLNEAFRTASKFPDGTNVMRRQVELKGISHAEQDMKEMREFYKGLSKDQKILVSHLIESGGQAPTELQPFVDKATDMFRQMGEKEVDAKVFRNVKGKEAADHLLDNYVYHYYEGGTKAERDAFKASRRKAVGPESPGFTKQRQLKTLKEAKAAGLKPVEAIDDILAKRIGKHYQAVARSEYVNAVTKEFGTEAGRLSKNARAELMSNGYREAKSLYAPKGTMFPDHIAKSLEVLDNMHNSDELYNSFLRVFDKAQQYWKFGATSVNPGHHIRNMIGDAWNGWIDGIANPKYYEQAARAASKDAKLTIKVGDVTLTKPEILALQIDKGAKSGFTPIELSRGERGIGSHIRGKINTVGEAREDYMRMAHFLGALQQEGRGAKTLAEVDKAAERAAARVRKWKIDYGDITDFEKNVMKRAMPFYTWSRKNIPLQIEALALHPHRISVIPKGQAAIMRLMGQDQGDYGSTFNDLGTIPDWLKEMAPVRLQGEGEGKSSIYWVPPLPFQDIGRYTEGGEQGVLRSIVSQMTPFARVPIERATGQQLFSGSPNPSTAQYFANQNPMLRQIFNTVTGKQAPLSMKNLNYLTGAGVYEVTPQQRAGQVNAEAAQLRKAITEMRKKIRTAKH